MTDESPDYMTVYDARTALINSGVLEWFDRLQSIDDVARWMFRNNATAEEAAKHYGVA